MKKYLVLLILLSLSTFSLMLRWGIYTMHDFHVFRLFEFTKSISDGIFPARWSPDSGMGYGEPLFIFYGQFPYWLGQMFREIGFSVIDSTKALFIVSLIGSGLTMFILSRRYWGNLGGLVSGIFYMYAPYRAVDVWVRGALPEAVSFVFFPLVFYFLDRYLYLNKSKYLFYFSLTYSLLLINHNLSTYMITPFIFIFWLFTVISIRSLRSFIPLICSGILSLMLAAFYVLPVVFENSLTTVTATTQSYYSFQLHYATLKQLFISNFWGYGGSVWGQNDTLSFSVGYLHWLLPLISIVLILIRKKIKFENISKFYLFTGLGLLAIFLTHGKAEFIWKLIPGMSFVQFPWRFLSPAVFFLSLAAGLFPNLIHTYRSLVSAFSILAVILLNFNFYRPDIWRSIDDNAQFNGKLWDEQRSSALQDYWPKTAPTLPVSFATEEVIFNSGQGKSISSSKNSHSAWYSFEIMSQTAKVSFPIVYFPGWVGKLDNKAEYISPDASGLISLNALKGWHKVSLEFKDTPIRQLGNILSLFSLLSWVVGLLIVLKYEKK